MAKLKVFVIHDSKIEAYDRPFFARATGEALRMWETTCNDGQSMMSKHPGDYTLFEIGEYDDKTGRIEVYETFRNLGLALEAKKQPSNEAPLMRSV